jgi:membrane protease YdiL (CAAX protease family)
VTLIELTDGVDRRPAVGSVRSWIRFLAGFAVLCVALFGTSALDASGRWGLAILAATLVTAVAVERVEHRARFADVLRVLGLGRPGVRALAVALVVSGLVLLVFPLTTAVSGAEVELRADWPWLLIGLFAFHGLAEELVWRALLTFLWVPSYDRPGRGGQRPPRVRSAMAISASGLW